MQYVIANRGKATMYGINAAGHRTKDALIVLHEKELNVVPGPTLADKVRAVNGVLYSASEIKQALQEGGWQ